MIVVDAARMRHPINHDHGNDRLRRSVRLEARYRATLLGIVSAQFGSGMS
jgi:hypothetical protein